MSPHTEIHKYKRWYQKEYTCTEYKIDYKEKIQVWRYKNKKTEDKSQPHRLKCCSVLLELRLLLEIDEV